MTQTEREPSPQDKTRLVRTALDNAKARIVEAAEATGYLAEIFGAYVEDDDETVQRAALLAARVNRLNYEIRTL